MKELGGGTSNLSTYFFGRYKVNKNVNVITLGKRFSTLRIPG